MKVAIYCRLSEEDKNKIHEKDDSESIQNQKNMLIEYAINNQWEIYDIYSDDDYNGADRTRPEFNRLLRDAEKRNFDIILCKTQSRFTRELELVEKYIHGKFLEWNIRFIGYADHADTYNLGNKKARQINGLVNEWYLEDLSNSIRSVFDMKKRAGQHIGSFALYGYVKDANKKGHLLIDWEAAMVVREVFSLFIQGYGKTSIARILNERGIPNPTEYKRLKGLRYKHTSKNHNSTLWKYSTIQSMLSNEMYIGTMVQSKQKNLSYKNRKSVQIPKEKWIRVPNMHEAIIDYDTWNSAQKLINERCRPWNNHNKIGIFSKKVKCLYCGYYLKTQKAKNGRNLQCCTKYISKDSCIGCSISYQKLEKIVFDELHSIIQNFHISKKDIVPNLSFQCTSSQDISKLKEQILHSKDIISDCESAIKNLYFDKDKGIFSEEEWIELANDFQNEKRNQENLLKKYNRQILFLEENDDSSFDIEKHVQKYFPIHHLERIHLDELIDYIEIGKYNSKTKSRIINIHWKF